MYAEYQLKVKHLRRIFLDLNRTISISSPSPAHCPALIMYFYIVKVPGNAILPSSVEKVFVENKYIILFRMLSGQVKERLDLHITVLTALAEICFNHLNESSAGDKCRCCDRRCYDLIVRQVGTFI